MSLKRWGILPFFVSQPKAGLRHHLALRKWRLVEGYFNDYSGVSTEAEMSEIAGVISGWILWVNQGWLCGDLRGTWMTLPQGDVGACETRP